MIILAVIYNQLKQLPTDFFYDTITSNNFMRICLKVYFSFIFIIKRLFIQNFLEIGLSEHADKKLKSRCLKLQQMLKEYFFFDVSSIAPEMYINTFFGNNILFLEKMKTDL